MSHMAAFALFLQFYDARTHFTDFSGSKQRFAHFFAITHNARTLHLIDLKGTSQFDLFAHKKFTAPGAGCFTAQFKLLCRF